MPVLPRARPQFRQRDLLPPSLDTIALQFASSRRALSHSSLSSDSLLDAVPIDGLSLRGAEETSTAKRDASPLLKLDSALKRDDDDEDSGEGSEHPPLVRGNTLQFLEKLGKTNLLDPLHAKRALIPRQNSVAIPTQYAGINSGPTPGVVAGIVLGSVGGFLLIVWLLWLISNGGGVLRSSTYIEDDVVISRRRSRSPGTRRSHRSQREMTSRSPRRERVIRQERIVRDRSMPAPRETSRLRDTIIIDEPMRPERRVDGDDIVEVIEEHSSVSVPPPRRSQKSKRSSGYR